MERTELTRANGQNYLNRTTGKTRKFYVKGISSSPLYGKEIRSVYQLLENIRNMMLAKTAIEREEMQTLLHYIHYGIRQ